MKIKVKHLGALREAEFTLGELTIICGGNNTGKTYATYALFGFLFTWRRMLSIQINDDKIENLLADGVIRLDIEEYVKKSQQIVAKACQRYTQELPKIFAAPIDKFKQTEFNISLEIENKNINLASKFDRKMRAANAELFSITKSEESTELVITLLIEKDRVEIPRDILKVIISDALKDIIFDQFFPRPFIASAERTGAAIFRKELNFAKNRLLEEMGQADKNIDKMELLLKEYDDYALPIKTNVDFTRNLETIIKKNSFITDKYPDILADFSDIIGGEYTVTRNDELYYVPKGKRVKLSMDESSSAVRSLLDIGFYLKHEAQVGDLLMVDEPELNLHPENQRRIARLFARLVNLGMKVFITTHSDYIIKELNTLIMLNHDKPHLKRIAQQEGYRPEELIAADKIKVYIAEETDMKLEGNTRKTKCQTLTLADINPELGIEARSFDTTIETMNRIQEAIVWSEE
ncbi:ATP-binding protein [Dolichospermum sp. ST_con]|nr:ATP-binding protein [Dolichospermum sp. ST_con]MDD1420595.1 ATP-binding protein [Dolichospermum sp. ST_sed1]MDD1423114.1 ATP-binding protein [Dolichospermum sp. ST_sed9]MDD1432716.1 ATP-binding protein [Dolichospermum sp. ST_sed6]MDD1438322.1 ATP-binding protein [Dolichospermum sp. ST_sed10]MDD1440329.1 ATP-binding protein [Dolichospermum sp. ST_sed3]MDD1448312.1 ATP-binding protein [Dolichospermum sp. ST_sed8]MDD1456202.1 ATP-binding protein [Dolichospermum sp. ST_sed7]MDD1462522.1 ATP-